MPLQNTKELRQPKPFTKANGQLKKSSLSNSSAESWKTSSQLNLSQKPSDKESWRMSRQLRRLQQTESDSITESIPSSFVSQSTPNRLPPKPLPQEPIAENPLFATTDMNHMLDIYTVTTPYYNNEAVLQQHGFVMNDSQFPLYQDQPQLHATISDNVYPINTLLSYDTPTVTDTIVTCPSSATMFDYSTYDYHPIITDDPLYVQQLQSHSNISLDQSGCQQMSPLDTFVVPTKLDHPRERTTKANEALGATDEQKSTTIIDSCETKVRQITVQSINAEHRAWIDILPSDTGLSLAEKIHIIATFRTKKIVSITTASNRKIPIDNRLVIGSWMEAENFKDGEQWSIEWSDNDRGTLDKLITKFLQVNNRVTLE
ncbi:hypothetical protein BDF20DRAFT_839356 [Mycotypha africana]|uniref:uncharacterized protein n=1 Tax=Mycotypha africana TaxID=64632 RepID=UPI002300B9D3|nr:uncharacterized protein BDF20DRAFT_839356 [Mycotypha africana]KAI8968234.1 hypothetical protein BDF20DRAFT_839356 [Mycotypha africana]